MATLCLTRLCMRSSPRVFQHVYVCETISAAATSLFNNHDEKVVRFSTCGASKPKILIPRKYHPISCHYAIKVDIKPEPPKPKKSLLQRFKEMYRDYWYVLVPVHLVTSAGWFGGFYYLAKSGVDIAGILESWNVSEKITSSLKDSSMGYLAVSYALYKLATPLRYTVTLGGTTVSINYLKHWGYIKPVPSTDQLKEMYKERRENFMETFRGKKELYQEKKDTLMESMRETKIELTVGKDPLKDKNDIIVKEFHKDLRKIKDAKVNLGKPEELIKISKKEESG
ncbi:hypothetical protein ILUMI_02468 [Ignelater luminosus]|uniref:DUF1279 domain-containing protein n=1 Tax=Ignelater luminosus TaxID=2038154 RepID=A0A8K0DI34_IGNLU|nr:hypothetical protein ILUMI_02468 [Ignelater luminosus]